MPRLKTNTQVTEKTILSQNNIKLKCINCGKEKSEINFYKSNSILCKNNYERMFVCKDCLLQLYGYYLDQYNDFKSALYHVCRLLDVYFEYGLYEIAEQQVRNKKTGNPIQIYFQKLNSLPQYSDKTFCDSILLNNVNEQYDTNDNSSPDLSIQATQHQITEEDKKNKNDVIRMVGYDPFENENPQDKKYLYNSLVDFLDESTLEDSFKLPIVIEIVKSFNQIDKINQSLALMTSNVNGIKNQVGDVKSLVQAKQGIYNSILAMAKDNGISVNHNNSKSKGAGTLTGIIKKLQELGFEEAEINLFDIQTSAGLQQVADISNQSILKQLMFDENDYTEMLKEQVILIDQYRNKAEKLEEENRILKLNTINKEQVGDN